MISKLLQYIGIGAIILALGIYLGKEIFTPKKNIVENSNVVVEKIEKVAKLITVETHLSENYKYKDYWDYDVSFLRKEMLLIVKAKVSAGYDLEKLNIRVDSKTKTVKIGPLPPVEILSIDHNVDYSNIEEGLFNSFKPEDYTKINASAKDYIAKIASNDEVLKTAHLQESTMLELMEAMANTMGYKFVVEKINKN